MRIVEAKTIQTNAFKTCIEALKEILTDANIEVSDTGLRIVAMDPSQTVLVHLKLNANSFETFVCKKNMVLGLSMLNFSKLIRTMTNHDSLTLFIDDNNENVLGIIIENGEKNSITTYELNLMDLNQENIEIPPATFESTILMNSDDFQKICRDARVLSDTIEIKNVGNMLEFSCKGDFASRNTVIGETTCGLSFLKQSKENEIIQGYYNLNHLVLFTKCTNLCNQIEIYMKSDFPIVIKFSVGSLGDLKLALAPQAPI